MPSCREVEPLVTPYVDGEASAAERAVVDAHLQACPPCRQHAEAESAVRQTVKARLCRPCAPAQLRARCRAAARTGPFGTRATLASLALAAALALVVGGVLLYGLTRASSTVLAAQLALDHMTCFAVHDASAPVDARASEAQYLRDYGQRIRLPQAADGDLQLVGVRRCYCGEGAVAHVMYRLGGRPVSLYMMAEAARARDTAGAFGHDSVIWSKDDTTYILIAREPRASLEALAARLDAGL